MNIWNIEIVETQWSIKIDFLISQPFDELIWIRKLSKAFIYTIRLWSWSTTFVGTTNNAPSLELSLSCSSPLFLFFRFWWVTVWTSNSILPQWGFHVGITHRLLASIAKLESSLHQTMLNRYSFVKHKALTLPEALFLWNFLQVFQNPTFQMINLKDRSWKPTI